MTQQISTGGGAGHLTGCACPFCLSNATTAEVTDVDLVAASAAPDETTVMTANTDLQRALNTSTDVVERASLARYIEADYPEAVRIDVHDYDDGNGPDAFIRVYDAQGGEIDGLIAPFRPEGLSCNAQDFWSVDIAEAVDTDAKTAAVKEGHRQALAIIAEAYPEWNVTVPPPAGGADLSWMPGMGTGSRTLSEQDFRQQMRPGRMMFQRSWNGSEWTGPLASNVVRIKEVSDRQVVVSYLDSTGNASTSGGPMRGLIGSNAVDDTGRLYLLDGDGKPLIAYDPMN